MKKTKTKSIQDRKKNHPTEKEIRKELEEHMKTPEYISSARCWDAEKLLGLIIKDAEKGNHSAIHSLWDVATTATKAIMRMARNQKELLQTIAQNESLMPSFRSIYKSFDADFDLIADNIKLGSNLPIKQNARGRFNSQITRYVNDAICLIDRKRRNAITMYEMDEKLFNGKLNQEQKDDREDLYNEWKERYGKYWELSKLPELSISSKKQWWNVVEIECLATFEKIKNTDKDILRLKEQKRYYGENARRDYFIDKCLQSFEHLILTR